MSALEVAGRQAQRRLMLRTHLSSVSGSLMLPMVFLLSLGADAFHLGLLNGFVSLAILLQIIGLLVVCKVPKARAVLVTDVAVGVVSIGLATLALVGPRSELGLYAAMALIFTREMTLTVTRAAWMPLLQDNVPEDDTSRFFSQMRTGIFLLGFLTTVFVAWYLGDSRDPRVFAPIMLAAAVFQMTRGLLMHRVPEVWEPTESPLRSVIEHSKLAMREPDFRATFVLTGVFSGTLMYLVPPILNSYLDALGYDLDKLVYLLAARNLGAAASLWIWAKPIDRYGPRVLLTPSVLVLCLLIAAKAFIPAAGPDGSNPVGTAMIYSIGFLDGVFFFSCLRLLMTKIHFRVIRKEWQTESFALLSYASAILGLVLPPLAGLAVRMLDPVGITIPGVAQGSHGIVILVSAVLMVSALSLRSRLPGYSEERSSGDVLRERARRLVNRATHTDDTR